MAKILLIFYQYAMVVIIKNRPWAQMSLKF